MFYFILVCLLFFWLFVSLWWYLSPESMMNVKYKTNYHLEKLNEPHLIIASHCYNTVDAMIMCGESKKTKKTINIISEFKISNRHDLFNQFWKSFPIYTSYRKINLYKGLKNNLVEKSKKYLEKEHILMFLKEQNKSTGIYHILKEKKVPILFVKIYRKDEELKETDKSDMINSFYGKEFSVDYNIVKDYNIDKEPEDFMKWVKSNLYD